MKPKQNDVSTVIIVNKSEQRTIRVKTSHLNRIQHYAFTVIAVILLLSGTIFYLKAENQRQEAENLQLLTRLRTVQNGLPANLGIQETKTTPAAQVYIQTIEGKLKKINEYLGKRGLKGFSTKDIGGNGNTETAKLSDTETYSLYSEYLDRLLHTVAFTPMGYPRVSSLTSFFGYRSDPFNTEHAEFHPGIDFKGLRGDEAKCTANGRVVSAGWYGGYGNCVRIQHDNNFETLYGHLSRITVKVGQQVTAGQKVGEVGSTGHSTGNHLHYEVRKNGKPINPVKFLSLNN
jgi:murein DD-endopeptidase MepM/ murein hydrolase activator NlpD